MRRGILAAGGLAIFLAAAVAAPGITIKLGSLAPAGSPWELGLKRLAAEWEKISGGTVTVKIYAGGVAGDEPDMIRKVRIGTLNAGLRHRDRAAGDLQRREDPLVPAPRAKR